ncbi:hypothetical protein A2264_03165 [candidate division WWE3 bacterium RIFOXYA2_FULL_46_9]|uniref:HTH cro/C1-type domain-containing protein n=1 Tax=candidate division WWE3 bacterium RIFOXYA2_FULL_46_9 TaxID=1802636 RepID=A0A1F4VYM3_UNCKA|nr:MAG: hypothetical protein A2264_03165 [candidate division WWE3 bacterium RIFOXYA2_FULL_46_9]OGC64367.1 MAG: hypothetical protein A2326_00820 [candidate division WWE3 bacterium RIFOXYB2_FULL_41_6]
MYTSIRYILLLMENNKSSIIGTKIRGLRLKLNISQASFGKKIGLSGKAISSYETGVSEPPLRVLEDISDTYSTPLIRVDTKNKLENLLTELRTVLEESITF